MWNEPDKEERIVSCQWHLTWTVNRSTILGKLACLVLSKILGIGTAERNWKQVKKIEERRSLQSVYGGYIKDNKCVWSISADEGKKPAPAYVIHWEVVD